MAIVYRPEQLPKLLNNTEFALQKIEEMNHPFKNQRLGFFQASLDSQLELAEQQLNKIQHHLDKLDELQDHYFTAAITHFKIAKEQDEPLYYDDLQVLKGRLEANIELIEKLVLQKTPEEISSLRFLTNQLTQQKQSLKQIDDTLKNFVEKHSNESVRNGYRIEGLKNRVEKLRELLPNDNTINSIKRIQ